MAIRTILTHPDPALRAVCEAVDGADVGALVDDLVETMRAHGAIGLSAPQIGDLRRVAVIEGANPGDPARIFVDPEIVQKRCAFGFVQESCLSVPGVRGTVMRDTNIRVGAYDRVGARFEVDLAGMDAVCLQHELDHLDGRLFIDRLSFLRRLALRARGIRTGEPAIAAAG